MLVENTLFGVEDKIKMAIELLRILEPEEGYYVAFSGGKDSIVIKDLVIKSGVRYDIHYQNTTIEPPELVAYIRQHHPDAEMHYPKRPYFKELVKRGFPMRQGRWCCEYLKEYGGINRTVVTGIRKKESRLRRMRKQVEPCIKQDKWFVHPIFYWDEGEVWEYIRGHELPYCKLYDEGFKRLGCLLCPFATNEKRILETQKYPNLTKAYIKAFEELYKNRKEHGAKSVDRWLNGKEMFWWWITNKNKEEEMPLFA